MGDVTIKTPAFRFEKLSKESFWIRFDKKIVGSMEREMGMWCIRIVAPPFPPFKGLGFTKKHVKNLLEEWNYGRDKSQDND